MQITPEQVAELRAMAAWMADNVLPYTPTPSAACRYLWLIQGLAGTEGKHPRLH